MKILVSSPAFCQPGLAELIRHLEGLADEVVINPYGRTLTKEEIYPLWQNADGIIAGIEPYSSDVLAKAPATLKVITRYGAGYNSVDVEAAAKKGIRVSNTPGVNAPAVADLTLGLMLAIARRIPQYDARTRAGKWSRYVGVGLRNHTLGIVGLGAIGKEVALRAKGFGMKIIAYDPVFDQNFADSNGIMQASLDQIYESADFITLHVPVMPQTEHMINAETLSRMKPSAILINSARGELIDESALLQALKDKTIAGAALDVFETEPLLESPLFELDNIVVTPHLAGHTSESEYLMGKMSIENTIRILNGDECKDIVNLRMLQ